MCVAVAFFFMSCSRSYMSLVFGSISGVVLGLEGIYDVPTVRMEEG